MHEYLNTKTFDKVKNIIEVDSLIIDTISILNKKGYKTLYCCSGHVKDPRIYEEYKISKDKINDFVDYYIKEETEDEYTLLAPYSFTAIYIKFDKKYNFINLPKGFIIKDDIIEKIVDYYKNNKRRSLQEIDNEIKLSNKELLNWAKEIVGR